MKYPAHDSGKLPAKKSRTKNCFVVQKLYLDIGH